MISREHVIPQAAGNSGWISVHSLYSLSKGWSRGEIFQAGLTRSTLCPKCNSNAGRHYVPAFARWTLQAAEYHPRIRGDNHVLLPFTICPLPISKQIAVMTLAMSLAQSIDLPHYLRLRRFVLSPRRREVVQGFRFLTYLHFGPAVFEGVFYAIDTQGGPSPMVHCHVGIEPLGYVVTADYGASRAWAQRLGLCDITRFAAYDPGVLRVEYLNLRCLRGEMPFRSARHANGR